MSLVAGVVAGADSIDDMALRRHGAMGKLFSRPYAPSTLGSFPASFHLGGRPTRSLEVTSASSTRSPWTSMMVSSMSTSTLPPPSGQPAPAGSGPTKQGGLDTDTPACGA
jgi:hypothetical protein